jgi:hypothetical protein
MIVHLADVSNPTKPWRLCYKWIDLLFLEFFKQGDKERERGLPISFLMDRHTTNIAKAQGGFIDHFIKPAYNLLLNVCPKVELNMRFLESNKRQWALLEDSYSLENDPNVNNKNESDILNESGLDPSATDTSDIMKRDNKWRRASINSKNKKRKSRKSKVKQSKFKSPSSDGDPDMPSVTCSEQQSSSQL